MPYVTIKNLGEDSFEEKKSEFIGYAKRIDTEDEAKEFINEIKAKHKQARHNCFAYVIGENMGIQRYSDDGEPQGTAGIPILEVMKKGEITDCVIVVTRYFGGVLLGTGGLTRAYKKGASIAIKSAEIVEKVHGLKISFKIEYDLLGKIQYVCNQRNWHLEDIKYEDNVTFTIISEKKLEPLIENEIINVTNGKVKVYKSDEGIYFKEDNRLFCEL